MHTSITKIKVQFKIENFLVFISYEWKYETWVGIGLELGPELETE